MRAALALAAALAAGLPAAAFAQAYPAKPVRVIVPFAPAQFAAQIRADLETWRAVVKDAGIKGE